MRCHLRRGRRERGPQSAGREREREGGKEGERGRKGGGSLVGGGLGGVRCMDILSVVGGRFEEFSDSHFISSQLCVVVVILKRGRESE